MGLTADSIATAPLAETLGSSLGISAEQVGLKAGSYGGYEVNSLVGEFNKDVYGRKLVQYLLVFRYCYL